jgi:hypothetical protein
MTFLGKLVVLVNLVFSAGLAIAAFAAYSSGIDWSTNKGDKDRPAGKLVAVQAEIAELTKQLQLADSSWRDARAELRQTEDRRRADRTFYQTELHNLFVSKDPINIVGPDAPGATTARPAMVKPDPALSSLTVYQGEVQQLREQNARLRKDLDAKVKEDTALTNLMTGDPEKKTKGLRKELVEERDKYLGLNSEAGIAAGMRINALVERELIQKRLDSVNEGVAQLRKYLKMKHGVDAPAK